MHPGSPLRAILTYCLVGVPAAVLVFLLTAKFFAAWDGYVVAVRPIPVVNGEPTSYEVLVANENGDERVLEWKRDVALGRNVPVTQLLAAPPTIPDTAPHTMKSRFRLHYLVEGEGGGHDIIPTTSPASVVLALFVFLLGLAIRNMVMAGSPFSFESRRTVLPAPLPPAGHVADNRVARSKQGPPPPRPRKGRGR